MRRYAQGQAVEVSLPMVVNLPPDASPAARESPPTRVETLAGLTQWHTGTVQGERDSDGFYSVELNAPPIPAYQLVRVPEDQLRLPPDR